LTLTPLLLVYLSPVLGSCSHILYGPLFVLFCYRSTLGSSVVVVVPNDDDDNEDAAPFDEYFLTFRKIVLTLFLGSRSLNFYLCLGLPSSPIVTGFLLIYYPSLPNASPIVKTVKLFLFMFPGRSVHLHIFQ
jgi:hypothetical protein